MAPIALDIDDGVATLTLDPPGEGYDRAFTDALAQAAAELTSRHPEVRSVLVRSSGADIGRGWGASALAEDDALRGVLAPIAAPFDAFAAIPQPSVVAIGGAAHSAGLELALACDVRVAAEGATFALPETSEGTIPRGGGTQRLPSRGRAGTGAAAGAHGRDDRRCRGAAHRSRHFGRT